jgi:hypothetical protein
MVYELFGSNPFELMHQPLRIEQAPKDDSSKELKEINAALKEEIKAQKDNSQTHAKVIADL